MKLWVIGAGTMGAGIAQTFASGGFEVVLYDMNNEIVKKGYNNIENGLAKLVAKGKLTEQQKNETLDRLHITTDIAAAKDAAVVVEAVFENIEIKKELFKKLDSICDISTIFASNTSALSITEMATATNRAERFIGMHFFNPVPLMKLIEIIRGAETSNETFETIKNISIKIGKDPIEVNEAAGFVVNRLMIPMLNEAAGLLAEGVASREDIDKAMMLGANHPMGPFQLADMIGIDIVLSIMDILVAETGDNKYRAHPLIRKMVRAGFLGRKTGRGFYNY